MDQSSERSTSLAPSPSGAAPAASDPVQLLADVFGFSSFRPHQEAVCREVMAGHDVLLVMPTGAGKSLCYQLPGLARGGTTLVISPLIALMEDQVAKLASRGLRAGRIHSGRDRLASRQTCRDYLDGALDYLFVAPERLKVAGFPEMLARRPPVLVAVDEAHCISAWGHDFRPDYRMLEQRLALLRPTPLIAMTATATPRVQQDIVAQLGMRQARQLIHGFRRENLAVEVVALAKPARAGAVQQILAAADRRPAIVYAATRKEAEAVAATLAADLPCAAYHAGMPASKRDQVQSAFLSGELEVIVATIAFGMGVDKADVRTVIHTALPANVEGFYQEIGRAGRDGLPARAVLFCSYADQRMQQFFIDRDYPDIDVLQRTFALLQPQPQPKERLRAQLDLPAQPFDSALEKLWLHGGACVDPAENVWRGQDGWQEPYLAQRRHRLAQLTAMARFSEGGACRMLELVRHFGDEEDHGRPCGRCDFCAPGDNLASHSRPPSAEEASQLWRLLEALVARDGQTLAMLHRDALNSACTRDQSDEWVRALAQSGLLTLSTDRFRKDGHEVVFQRAHLSADGRRVCRKAAAEDLADRVVLAMPRFEAPAPSPRKRTKSDRAPRRRRKEATATGGADLQLAEAPAETVRALKAWRLEVARQKQIPAFRVLSDRVLIAIASESPTSTEDLGVISGIGPKLLRLYGEQILSLLSELT